MLEPMMCLLTLGSVAIYYIGPTELLRSLHLHTITHARAAWLLLIFNTSVEGVTKLLRPCYLTWQCLRHSCGQPTQMKDLGCIRRTFNKLGGKKTAVLTTTPAEWCSWTTRHWRANTLDPRYRAVFTYSHKN